jgi:choline-glycine betaine transporter
MTLLASSGLAALLPLLLIVACPLMMIFMMRGMHGGHGGGRGQAEPKTRAQMSMDELKHARDELNEEIGQRAEQDVYSDGRRSGALR